MEGKLEQPIYHICTAPIEMYRNEVYRNEVYRNEVYRNEVYRNEVYKNDVYKIRCTEMRCTEMMCQEMMCIGMRCSEIKCTKIKCIWGCVFFLYLEIFLISECFCLKFQGLGKFIALNVRFFVADSLLVAFLHKFFEQVPGNLGQ